MSDEVKKVIGYIRVSTEEQVRDGFSLDNQKGEIEKHCSNNEYELVEIYSDEGISGARMQERNGLISALRDIKEGRANCLVAWKISRLSRRIADVVKIVEMLDSNKASLVILKDNIDTNTTMGEPFLYIAGIFAEMERDNIIMQVKAGMKQKAREGQWNGGVVPLGYDVIDKKLIVNENEAGIVKLIYELYLKANGYKAIAKLLNDKGIKTKNDKAFNINSVKGILTNPTYAGEIRWGKLKNWGKKNVAGERSREYAEDCIRVNGIHQAIIDKEVFNKVQELIKENPRSHVKQFSADHMLSGLLRCPNCGYGMSVQQIKSRGNVYQYYGCNKYMNNHSECSPNLIRKDKIEEEFYTLFEKIVNNEGFKRDIRAALGSTTTRINELEKDIIRHEKNLKKLKEQEGKLFNELIEGSERFKNKVRERIDINLEEQNKTELEIKAVQNKINNIKERTLDLEDIEQVLQFASKALALMEGEAKKRLVRKLIKKIEVEDKCIKEIHFNFEEGFGIKCDKQNRIINRGGF